MSQTEGSNTAPQSAPPARRWQAALSVGCVVLFAVLMHWPLFVQGKTMSAFDVSYFAMGAYKGSRPSDMAHSSNGLLSDPVLLFNVWDKAMYEGPLEYPWLWNPYAACGSPLLANAQSAPFFPLKALAYGPFGVYGGFGVLCFLKMLLAGLFMWAYMRALGTGYMARTLGAIGFMACGFMVAWLQYPITSVAFTLPLVFLACEYLLRGRSRRGFLIAAIATALGLLGGHPETSFHITVAAAAYLVGRLAFTIFARQDRESVSSRSAAVRLGVFLLAVLVGATVAAVQVVPTVEAVRLSALLTARSTTHAEQPPSPVLSIGNRSYMHHEVLSHLTPNTWGNPSLIGHWWNKFSNYNESAGYVGVGVMLWALFGWRYFRRSATIRTLCILQVLSLGFILNVPLITNSLGKLPLFNIAANKRFLLVYCFASVAVAALVLDRMLKAEQCSRTGDEGRAKASHRLDIVWMSLVALVFSGLVLHDFVTRFATNPHDWIPGYGRRQLAHFVVFLVAAFCLVFLPWLGVRARRGAAVVLVGLAAADLFLMHSGYNPCVRSGLLYPDTPATRVLQAEPAPTRVLPVPTQISPNILALYELGDPRIYDAVVYGPYKGFLSRLGWSSNWNVKKDVDLRVCSFASVRFIWAEPDWVPATAESEQLKVVYQDAASTIYENRDARPRAYVSRQWREAASPDEAYDVLTADDGAWESTTVVELRGADAPKSTPADGETVPHTPVEIAEHTPHRVTLDLDGEMAGLLVLSDCYYPGWTARVDGQRRPIYRANGTFRGVFVGAGDRRVVFTFEPASFRYGLMLTIAGLVVLVAVAIVPRLRGMRRRAGSSTRQ